MSSRRLLPRPSPSRHPVSPTLRRWLEAPGSLTMRLRATGHALEVQRLSQCTASLLPGEAASIGGAGSRPRAHVREVLLVLDGQPVVWARSIAPARAVAGPWRSLRSLGSRPLAELLFSERWVSRSPLFKLQLRPGSPWQRHLQRACAGVAPELAATRCLWARWSVFVKGGQPLRVLEAFLPGVAERDPYATFTRKVGRPSICATSSSPRATAPTPAGVPV